jgi:hypothetical protein
MVSHCQTGWYADQFSDNDRGYSPCWHRNVIVVTNGRRCFIAGDVFDNMEEHVMCMDCGEYLIESDVRGTWHGESRPLEPHPELEGDYENR